MNYGQKELSWCIQYILLIKLKSYQIQYYLLNQNQEIIFQIQKVLTLQQKRMYLSQLYGSKCQILKQICFIDNEIIKLKTSYENQQTNFLNNKLDFEQILHKKYKFARNQQLFHTEALQTMKSKQKKMIKNEMLDNQYQQLSEGIYGQMIKQFISKENVLKNLLINDESVITQNYIFKNSKNNTLNIAYKAKKQLKDHQIQFQSIEIKHKNSNLIEQIEMLQKQYKGLEEYLIQNTKKSQQTKNKYQQEHQQQQEMMNDINSQIYLIENLIISKNELVKDLIIQKQSLISLTSELQSTHFYLKKKKNFIKQLKIDKSQQKINKLNMSIQQLRSQIDIFNQMKDQQQIKLNKDQTILLFMKEIGQIQLMIQSEIHNYVV